MQSPFGRPLFDRLGLNPAAGPAGYATMQDYFANQNRVISGLASQRPQVTTQLTPNEINAQIAQQTNQTTLGAESTRPVPLLNPNQPSRALPLPQGYDPNVNQPSIGDFDGRFAQAAAQAANRNPNPLAGLQGPGVAAVIINAQIAAQNAPPSSYESYLSSLMSQPDMTSGPKFRQPGDMGRYVAFNDPRQPGAGFSNYQEYLAAGNSPASGPVPLAAETFGPIGGNIGGNPPPFETKVTPRPSPGIGLGGISGIAFPTLAPSNTNTFTGGLFGGNNPMNNNPMNGGGMNSNQPLSQQIPQVVQQAVTPLLQNTATQLNQGIGSMVNQSLVGGGGQTGVGGGGQTGFGGMQLPSYMDQSFLQNVLR